MAETQSNVIINDNEAEELLKPVKLKRLKPKDKLFVKKIVRDGKSGTQAYLETRSTTNKHAARVAASRVLAKPSIQNEIVRQLEAVGLTDESVSVSLNDLIDAGLANKKWAKPQLALNALRTVLELKDRFPAKKNINANLNMEQETMSNASIDELKSTLDKVHKENERIISLLEQGNS